MKTKKTWIDHSFDCLLILAPFTMLLRVDAYVKSMIMFYLFYLPYLVYFLHKETKAQAVKQIRKVTKKVIKKEEPVLV